MANSATPPAVKPLGISGGVLIRDGRIIHWEFWCPECGNWGLIDDDQYTGAVSIDHASTPGSGCTYHTNIDCRNIPHLSTEREEIEDP